MISERSDLPNRMQKIPGLAWLVSSLRAIIIEPFDLVKLSSIVETVEAQEKRRRLALLRLIIVLLTILQVGVAFPAAAYSHAPPSVLLGQLGGAGIGIVCLGLARRGHPIFGGALFVYGAVLGLFFGSLSNTTHIDYRDLLEYAIQTVFIVLSGLLLPIRYVWITTGVVIALLTSFLWIITPHVFGTDEKILIWSFLVVIYVTTATLTWIASRSARVGIEAVTRALLREQELATLKDLFIIDINHELRTPIMSMYNNLEILSSLDEGRSTPDVRQRVIGRGLQSGKTVLQMLRTILDTTIIDSQSTPDLNLQPIPLRLMVKDLLLTFDPRDIGDLALKSREREVDVDIDPDLCVLADAVRLRQVLSNLLTNALKYSVPGTPLQISAAPRKNYGRSMVQISLRDWGLGIPPDEMSLLFQRFVRLARDITGPVRGTGVGLYLCRRLVEAMDGTIWAESTGIPGEGTTMKVLLPSS